MKMKNRSSKFLLGLFLIGGSLLTACEKDDDITPAEKLLYPATITSYKSGDEIIAEYHYDEENRVVKIDYSDNQHTSFEYNASGNLLRIVEYYKNEVYTYDSLVYNADNRLVKVWSYEASQYKKQGEVKLEGEFVLTGWQLLEYNTDGLVNKTVTYNADGAKDSYTEYEYDGAGNMVKESYHWANYEGEILENQCMAYTYKYDDRNNIYKGLNIPVIWDKETYVNNKTAVKREDYEHDEISEWANTYEYNEENYPVKVTFYDGDYELIEYQEL